MSKIERVQKKYQYDLLSKNNVVGVVQGSKIVRGIDTSKKCITILVEKKLDKKKLIPRDVIPSSIEDVLTDVIETGEIKALGKAKSLPGRKERHRPLRGGISIGHPSITAGTLGCFVQDYGNKAYILSNNHVLANCNKAKRGDAIIQPGAYDGGRPQDKVGELADYIQINFSGNEGCKVSSGVVKFLNKVSSSLGRKSRFSYQTAPPTNYCDAAIASMEVDFEPEILDIGYLDGTGEIERNDPIWKSGRTTGYTTGKVLWTNGIIKVGYGTPGTALFTDQIITDNISKGGDSGSVGVDDENRLVGLLFAGSDSITVLNKISRVFEGLALKAPL